MRMKFEHQLHTDGSGLWSNTATTVRTTSIALAYVDDDRQGKPSHFPLKAQGSAPIIGLLALKAALNGLYAF